MLLQIKSVRVNVKKWWEILLSFTAKEGLNVAPSCFLDPFKFFTHWTLCKFSTRIFCGGWRQRFIRCLAATARDSFIAPKEKRTMPFVTRPVVPRRVFKVCWAGFSRINIPFAFRAFESVKNRRGFEGGWGGRRVCKRSPSTLRGLYFCRFWRARWRNAKHRISSNLIGRVSHDAFIIINYFFIWYL